MEETKVEERVEEKENKMGYVPVNKLLVSMATPMIISMLVQALYNVVDSVFVSRIGKEIVDENGLTAGSAAINALGFSFPIQMLLIAFGTGTCVGVNALLSKALGEKDKETIQKSANNGVFLSLMNFVLFFIIGAFFSEFIITAPSCLSPFVTSIDSNKLSSTTTTSQVR